MSTSTEAFSRVKIDRLLEDAGWTPTAGGSVLFEHRLPDGSRADYVLCNRQGRPSAVIEAKRASVAPLDAQDQGCRYAEQLGVPFVFLSNGEEVWFLDRDRSAYARPVAGFFSQDDLERRTAVRAFSRPLDTVPIDTVVAGRDYQVDCIRKLCDEITFGRRKMLVEMATGTGKTRMAAAFVKRLFEAGIVTRVLFLVDRIALAVQAEDVFTDHLGDYPCHVLRPSRHFDRTRNVVIATLQTMAMEYGELSPGYFDLVIVDECHRSIYGTYRQTLEHFDAIQLGLTATPCISDTPAGNPEDNAFVRDTLRFFELDKPTFSYGLVQAIGEGWLVPYQIYRAMTVKTAAKNGFKVERDEIDWDAVDERIKLELESRFGDAKSITVDPKELERRFTIPERNRAIVREFRQVLDDGFTGRDHVHHVPTRGKTIVFAVTRRHAEFLATVFDQCFADLKPDPSVRYADFVVSDVEGGPSQDADTIIRRFKNEQFPKILVSVNMLDTGFDCPEVVNLVMARFTESSILYRQMRGRGTRKAPNIQKTDFTIFDFTGVTEFHGDDENVPIDAGAVVVKRTYNPPLGSKNLLTIEVDDHIDPASRDWLTLDENGCIVQTQSDEARAAGMALRFEAWRGKQCFDAEQTRWVKLICSRVGVDSATMNGFHPYDFDTHPFSGLGGYGRAIRIFGGADALKSLINDFNTSVFNNTV